MKYISATKIVCDSCGYEFDCPFEEIPSWQGIGCPLCEAPDIVDDKDMEIWNATNIIASLQSLIDPEGKLEGKTVKLNTAELKGDL
jgi:hypothetical protein